MPDIIDVAKQWLNTPYHPGASRKGQGVDCAMFLVEIFHEALGIERPLVGYYSQDWHLHRSEEMYLNWVERYCDPVEIPQPGDIAMFQFGRTQSHGAIVISWPTIIHSYRGKGVIIDDGLQGDMLDKQGLSRLRGFWRVR